MPGIGSKPQPWLTRDTPILSRGMYLISDHMDRVKRIWYLSPMRAAKVQASLRIRAVSRELPLLAHTSSESRGTFRQKARSLAPLNDWACAVKICHDGMLEGTNSLDGAHIRRWTKCCDTYNIQSCWCFNTSSTIISMTSVYPSVTRLHRM